MTSAIGVFALALGWCGATVAALSALSSAWRGRDRGAAQWGALVALAGCVLAVAALEVALLRHDFSVRFVADNGSRDTPVYYTVTSLWAAHDGSLLLWDLVLVVVLAVVSLRSVPGAEHLRGWAMGIIGVVAMFFLGLTLFATGVFDRVAPVPSEGPGPTPLLSDHPAMGVHPPLLYLGLVILVVPFAYGVAALITGDSGPAWLDAVERPLRLAWTALTAGIVLGAWWSYAVLGWGGYWSWDPVENCSLVPWLLATALLHALVVQRRTGELATWTTTLAVLAFLLAAVGVMLTRSGVVASVHTFADSGVGPLLLGFVLAVVVAVVGLAVARAVQGSAERERVGRRSTSRATALLLNNVLLCSIAGTVLLGTLAPVAAEAFGGPRLSVGAPYFDRMTLPLATLLLLLMSAGPALPWQGRVRRRAWRRVAMAAVVGAAVAVGARWTGEGTSAATGMGLASGAGALAALQLLRDGGLLGRRAVLGGRIAHLGLALLAIGVVASSAGAVAAERTVAVGDTVSVGGVTATLVGVDRTRDERSMSTVAELRVSGGRGDGATVRPALRFFTGRQTTVAVPGVVSGMRGDVYATVLSVPQDAGRARLRLAVNPYVSWIWVGGAVMAFGGLVSGTHRVRRRRRTPAPVTRPADLPAAEVIGR